MMDWLAATYVEALNCIHWSHDKYAYERLEMALHDKDVLRTMAYGIAGLSVATDSLSAIKYAKVTPVRDERGIVVDYATEGAFPMYGNDDDRADDIAVDLVERFMDEGPPAPDLPRRGAHPVGADDHVERRLRQGDRQHARRPPRRRAVRPGRQPDERARHARDAGLGPVGREAARTCRREDGISLTNTVVPSGLGRTREEQVGNLAGLLDAYVGSDGYHMNVNVLNRETLEDAMEHPENYPQLTIRVSGYAVNFVRLTREQQLDVLSRTFHGSL